jgi:hypothetical protein
MIVLPVAASGPTTGRGGSVFGVFAASYHCSTLASKASSSADLVGAVGAVVVVDAVVVVGAVVVDSDEQPTTDTITNTTTTRDNNTFIDFPFNIAPPFYFFRLFLTLRVDVTFIQIPD